MTHRVKSQSWRDGALITKEFVFELLEEALEFAGTIDVSETVKIYNSNDELTHNISGVVEAHTYA